MVKYADIHKAIVNRIESKFGEGIVTATDVKEGIIRPSFFIEFDNVTSIDFMGAAVDRELTVRLYYFSKDKDRNTYELLVTQDGLDEIFLKDNILTIDEFAKVEIDGLEFNTVDKVLHCYFDIMLSEDYDRSIEEHEVDVMDDLHYRD